MNERVECRRGGLHEGAGGLEVQVGRDLESGPLVGESQLGLGGPADERHDPVSDFETGDAGSGGDDLACHFEPGDVLGDAWRGRVEADALHQICPVEPGSPNRHQQLVVAGYGVGLFRPLEAGTRCDRDCAHA